MSLELNSITLEMNKAVCFSSVVVTAELGDRGMTTFNPLKFQIFAPKLCRYPLLILLLVWE